MQTVILISHLKMPTATEIRLDNIVACLTPALILLNELSDAFGPPFVQLISNTVNTLINVLKVMVLKMAVLVTNWML
jgi:hypothetical protein